MTWLRSRDAKIDNLGLDLQPITGSHCIRPTQFIYTKTNRAFGEVQRLDKQTHRNRRGMPTAGDDPPEHCLARHRCIQMKRLRIELAREVDNFLFANLVCSRLEPITGLKIFKIALAHRKLFFCRIAPVSATCKMPRHCSSRDMYRSAGLPRLSLGEGGRLAQWESVS